MSHHYLHTLLTPAVRRAQAEYYGQTRELPATAKPDALGEAEAGFIARRDSFYLATVNAEGWPYIQHRGGPPGFLSILDAHTLAFADLGGNRQLLSTGNIATNDKVALFLMDYARRERLKVLGRAEILPARSAPALVAQVTPAAVPSRRVERVFRISVTGFDWNCPQHITPRFTAEEIAAASAPLHARIARLEAALARTGHPAPPEADGAARPPSPG